MNRKLTVFASQLLAALVIFIAFLLIFENKLVVPLWLQPAGRMHPLLLHFPIVLLLVAVVLDLFRFSRSTANNVFYHALQFCLFLSAALLCGVTVIMGLLLSREEGYEGEMLQWHKWTGALLFFIAAALFFIRNKAWYKRPFVISSGIVVVIVLILTGHYGATLTHGDNFVWQPLEAYKKTKQVPFDEAVVFADVIRPVLERKCTGCHNPDKLKGELLLTDSAGIMKGGKSGELFVPGSIETSLLLERIHMPLEEEKHMPPKGKIQLTDFEIELLTAWIGSQKTYFSEKVADLPETDTLRQLIAALLTTEADEERFDFPAASEKDIASLNTDYRTILSVAKGSPALSVNIYNREVYSSRQLEELNKIRRNIVALNVNKLPVTDDQLKTIRQFENLRDLNLNFTDISATGLQSLTALSHLRNLSLSGTKVGYAELEKLLPQFGSLQTLSVWNTPLTVKEMEDLQQKNQQLKIITGFVDDGADLLKLNPPQVRNKTLVFEETISPGLFHPVKGVEIRYTTDGSEPDSLNAELFEEGTVVNSNTFIKARAYKEGWISSDVVSFDFMKNTIRPDSAVLLNKLNHVHLAEGANTFFDTKLGAIGANNPAWANYFAGVRGVDMELVCFFNNPVTVQSYGIHYMVEETTGIYPPGVVEVWGGESQDKLKLIATLSPPLPEKGQLPFLKLSETSFKPTRVACLKIIAKPYQLKERRFLLLIDEMFLN